MRLRLTALLAALAFVLIAPTAVSAAYPGDCDTGSSSSGNYIRFVPHQWPGGSYLKYDGVVGNVPIKTLEPCINGSSKYGWSSVWVNLENLKDSTQASVVGIVQLGYIRVTSGYSVNGITGQKFAYVPNDTSMGVFEEATWAGNPITDHEYEFKIRSIFTGSYRWDFCIQDHTVGGPEKCHNEPASFHSGERPWWGWETYNSNDVLGVRQSKPYNAYLLNVRYRTTNGQWWPHLTSACSQIGTNAAYQCARTNPGTSTGNYKGYTID